MRILRRLFVLLALIAAAAIAVLAVPEPNFEHRTHYGQFEIFSDRPIPPQIRTVLDDVTRRLEHSELYSTDQTFRIFFCNDDWRMALYSQRFSSAVGGMADTWLTRNIYIRRSDIAANRLFPPTGVLADAEARPLSYFIAHEATHAMQSRAFGRLMALRSPEWLVEGYADYVGKGGGFGLEENRARLAAGDPLLDPERTNIYRRHHLLVAWLIDREGLSARRLFADPPEEEAVLRRVRGDR
ncbi:MAG TPA: hypothetical protein VF577_07155 [Allosphingosinicella sp.]|jgi:hypothetical protein